MLSVDTPGMIPQPNTHRTTEENTNHESIKVTGNPTTRRRKSAKPKRFHHKAVVDSGATVHCIRDRSLFTYIDTSKRVKIRVADKRVILAEGVGSCAVNLKSSDGKLHTLVLHNCVYSPKFSENLISTRRMWLDNRLSTRMGEHNYFKCHYFEEDCTSRLQPAARRIDNTVDLDIIHRRFNHCGKHRLRKMFDVTHGLGDAPNDMSTHECTACIEGGHKHKAFAKRRSHTYTYFGERISSDLCGPFPKSVDGYTFALCFVDSFTKYCALYLLKSKSSTEVREAFNSFLSDHKHYMAHNHKITWHTDNGGEFMSHDLDEFCHEFTVTRSFSVPYTPPQNAQAERMWGLLLRPVRTMLVAAKVHEAFWSYAIRHACQCHNVMPTSALDHKCTPWEALTGSKPDISRFRVWGCLVWYLVPDHEIESKVSPRAWPAVHLGFDPNRHGYLIYIPHKNRITTGFHITFQEQRFLKMTSEHVGDMPRIPKPLNKPTNLYKEPRDKRWPKHYNPPPALPAPPLHDDRHPSPPRDRGSDSEDRIDANDEPNNEPRPTRVGTYGPPPPRSTRNQDPAYM